jgi:MoaA/NifB/PqqE/SkfB family radical SAM enzyme
MKINNQLRVKVDKEGRIVLPAHIAKRYGLAPGEEAYIDESRRGLSLFPSINHIAKVYLEPTSRCNLECRTCIRHSWTEAQGNMSDETFNRIIKGIGEFDQTPSVFFGGFGEPLAHPHILAMVAKAKQTGAVVELITNGMLLSEEVSRSLIDVGLDTLWVSLDGATPVGYSDVRLGAALPEVLQNLQDLVSLRGRLPMVCATDDDIAVRPMAKPELGVVFVAMKRNIAELPAVIRIANWFGATRFMVTNVLPYMPEMCTESFYTRSLSDQTSHPESRIKRELPKIDMDKTTIGPLMEVISGGHATSLGGAVLSESMNRCPFINKGSTAVAWDGGLSPCLALLHDYTSYLSRHERVSRRHVVGNVNDKSIKELWNDSEYKTLRDRVQRFDFSPCVYCGGCDLSKGNEEDCVGNSFPTCGGCLWAQGIVQCP